MKPNDVSKVAEVSRQSVYNVINKVEDGVSPEKRRHIIELLMVDDSDYKEIVEHPFLWTVLEHFLKTASRKKDFVNIHKWAFRVQQTNKRLRIVREKE